MYKHLYRFHNKDTQSIIRRLQKQRFEYDCGATTVNNVLKKLNVFKKYGEILEDLKTNEEIGTYPEAIENFLIKNKIKFNKDLSGDFAIVLVSYNLFLPKTNEDYGHYIFIDLKNKFIYDPYENEYFHLEKFNVLQTKNVLVGNKRYNDIYFSFIG